MKVLGSFCNGVISSGILPPPYRVTGIQKIVHKLDTLVR